MKMKTVATIRNRKIETMPSRRRLPLSFSLRFCLSWLLALSLFWQSGGATIAAAAVSVRNKNAATKDVAPTTAPAPQSNVDLVVTGLETSGVTTDSQTLAISGNLGVTIQNLGSTAVNTQFRVLAFEDRNANGKYDAGTDLSLGSVNYTQSIAASASVSLTLPLSGTVIFKGNLIYVFADSDNTVVETNEVNNILCNYSRA